MVHRALRDIRNSPERSFRNLVDFGATVLKGRFSQRFINAVQTALQNENSAYYALVRDVTAHVDPDNLVTFGVNVGYNSCTVGAKKIRELESENGFDIPWSFSLNIDAEKYSRNEPYYESLISQGTELGIYTWIVWMQEKIYKVFPLIEKHPECAFVLCCPSGCIDVSVAGDITDFDNLMLAVEYGEDAERACSLLRENRRLYSVYAMYDANNAETITNGEFMAFAEECHPTFSVLIPMETASQTLRKSMYDFVVRAREKQSFRTVPWEAYHDNQYIDSIISEDVCSAGADSSGSFISLCERTVRGQHNIFEEKLQDILKNCYPKVRCHN